MKEAVIIGGGIIGLWCAYHLNKAGVQVTVVDKREAQDGCSFGNAGMIVPSHFVPLASPGIMAKGLRWMLKKDSPFYIRPRISPDLVQWLWLFYRSGTKKHVEESASCLSDMHAQGKALYTEIQQTSGFDFQLEQKGILMLYKTAEAEKEELKMAEEADQLNIETRMLTPDALRLLEPGIANDVLGAVHYPGDAHFTPHLFMHQMKVYLVDRGVEFLENHLVRSIEDKGTAGATLFIDKNADITTKQVVVAAGSWSGQMMKRSGMALPMQDGKGYSMTLSGLSSMPEIPALLHEARVAVTPMGLNLRISGTLEISGMDGKIKMHKVESIRKAVTSFYPGVSLVRTDNVWLGYRPCSPDGMPYIGRCSADSSIILATGHAMMGVSLAPATGRMVKDIFFSRDNYQVHKKLNPTRF